MPYWRRYMESVLADPNTTDWVNIPSLITKTRDAHQAANHRPLGEGPKPSSVVLKRLLLQGLQARVYMAMLGSGGSTYWCRVDKYQANQRVISQYPPRSSTWRGRDTQRRFNDGVRQALANGQPLPNPFDGLGRNVATAAPAHQPVTGAIRPEELQIISRLLENHEAQNLPGQLGYLREMRYGHGRLSQLIPPELHPHFDEREILEGFAQVLRQHMEKAKAKYARAPKDLEEEFYSRTQE